MLERCGIRMENRKFGNLGEYAKESANKEYVYSRLPENIRQIGETNGHLKIYIEDYVMTYIHQIFSEKLDKAIVVFLGKRGKDKAAGCIFIYGAISARCDIMEGPKELTASKWNQIYKDMHDNFPGAQMLGWGCGVSMWNSKADASVRQIHAKYFSEDGKILFVTDISEKEEKIFVWHDGDLAEQPGFVAYYEKNPQMQEYMLKGKNKNSIESSYQDNVTENMRSVIREKEDKKVIETKHINYIMAATMFIMLIIGAGLLYRSMDKIRTLETAVSMVEGYMGNVDAQAVMTGESSIQKDGNAKKGKKKNTKNSVQAQPTMDIDSTNAPTTNTLSPSRKPQKEDISKKSSAKKTSSYNGQYESYIVRTGDTLSQIVWKQYHSFYYLDKVMKANNIKNSDKIYEGDCIILPDFSKE